MSNSILSQGHSVYAFEIDDVLFPRREYILQVYYLFANFVDYTEGTSRASSLVDFMKAAYERDEDNVGVDVVKETLAHFELPVSYLENFERLRANATLPLKLFLTPQAKLLFKEIIATGKVVTILTDGNPIEQLNKLKHIDWGEFTSYLSSLKVYFVQELRFRNINPIDYIGLEYGVKATDILVLRQLY
ncbi:MAG: HAD family hydrolase [Sphingobacterium sp.]|uniref:hypothetical protein n=1 Tax=Sphingobacterium sp. JB170 TaxID=1434842 RepID=UPI000B360767|nr:hypothetical protein [Sphingobacterium sp. JB170]